MSLKDNPSTDTITDTTTATIAVLGPSSSFTELAARKVASEGTFVYGSTIPEIIHKITSREIVFGIVPLENLLHGPVTETFDALTKEHLSDPIHAPRILHSYTIPIEHYIGVPAPHSKIPFKEIREVYSHPQALAQSDTFLNKEIPKAQKIPVSSTSMAPEQARNSSLPAAAIASKEALLQEGFSVIGTTVSKELQNQTRFGILGLHSNKEKLSTSFPGIQKISPRFATSACLHPGKDRKGLLLEILGIISRTHECNMLSIHSRPDTEGGFIFYFEIEGGTHEKKVSDCISSLTDYCTTQTSCSARLLTFGSYQREPFKEPLIQSVCMVGAKGSMGVCLSRFFAEAGVSILEIDADSSEEEKKKISGCDTIFLSVPMREIKGVSETLIKYISPGALIVENCSVKTKALKSLEETFDSRYEILGIHTMFGPDITELKAKNIIITRTGTSGEKAKAFENLFYKHGANIYHADIEEHDKATAFLQALCQFYALGVADVMTTLEKEVLDSLHHFTTPNSERTLTSIHRILSQSPLLTEDLQNENPYAKEIRNAFIERLTRIQNMNEGGSVFEEYLNNLDTSLRKLLEGMLKRDKQ